MGIPRFGAQIHFRLMETQGKREMVLRVTESDGRWCEWIVSKDQHGVLVRELLEAVSGQAAEPEFPAQFSSAGEELIRTRHPHAYQPWSPEEDAKLLQERAQGQGVAHLARLLGRQATAIRSRLNQLGDPLDSQRPAVRPDEAP